MKVTVEYLTVPREGETENGDAALVRRAGEGVLIAVVDALGHGAHAAKAAKVALEWLAEAPLGRGIRPVIDGMHERLRGTRGAAAMLLLLSRDRLEGCGVGNVGLRAYNAQVPAMLTPGVLGATLNRLRIFQATVGAQTRMILYSDGISSRFDDEGKKGAPALATCQAIMARYRKPHDDATVLVTDVESAHDESVGASPKPPPPERAP